MSGGTTRHADLVRAIDSWGHGAAIAVGRLDAGPRITWVNPSLLALLGEPADRLIGADLTQLPGLPLPRRRTLPCLARDGSWSGVLADLGPGADRAIEVEVEMHDEEDGEPCYLLTARDITARRRAELQLERLAHHDALTGLPNRKLLQDRLGLALARARRYREALAVLFLDLDDFKVINDSLGHESGDQTLKIVAERLTRLVRASDTVARLGGDEFVLLLPGIGELAHAERLAERILTVVAEVINVQGHEIFITPSIGLAMWPDHGDTASQLLHHADEAMYQAKAQGKAGWVRWSPEIRRSQPEREALVTALTGALDRGELHLDGQPMVDALSKRRVGVEVALRWTHPTLGRVSPAQFLPLLANAELADRVWPWMLHTALDTVEGVQVCIDVSSAWLQRGDLVETVEQACAQAGRAASDLRLEVREHDLLHLHEAGATSLARLREIGVQIFVDQYGTSHLSLPRLRSLPLDGLKLDGSLARHHVHDQALLNGLVTLCNSLELDVHADGVRDERTATLLTALGVHVQQGARWGMPTPLTNLLHASGS